MIAWIDVETSGLDARKNRLLEIACIVTDDELNMVDEVGFHAIVHYTAVEVAQIYCETVPFVQEMHTKTGLWQKLATGTKLARIDVNLEDYLEYHGALNSRVGGNSVRLDMNFMDRHLPESAQALSYQMCDVTTVAKLAQSWFGTPPFVKVGAHTAMGDIRESIAELRYYRQQAFRAVSETTKGKI